MDEFDSVFGSNAREGSGDGGGKSVAVDCQCAAGGNLIGVGGAQVNVIGTLMFVISIAIRIARPGTS